MAAVCLMATAVVVAIITIGPPYQDSVVDQISHDDQAIDEVDVPTSLVREKSKISVVGRPVVRNETNQQATSSNELKNPKPQSRSNSINVVYEQDLTVDYSTHTKFQGTYFDQSPDCTPLESVEQVGFTLVTQASMDRLWIMQHHCHRWPAPYLISIAVYLPPDSPQYTEDDVANELDHQWKCEMSRMKVTVVKGISPMDQYPINLLRNMAIRRVSTSHFVYTDSDFLISEGLFEELMAAAPWVATDPFAALVVPAFAYFSPCPTTSVLSNRTESIECLGKEQLPLVKEDLLSLWKKRRQDLPNVKQGFHGKHFHGSTLYEEFQTQTEPLLLPCIENYLYEPYLAVRLCKDLPEFPEVFRGYGFNKNVWIMWLTRKLPYRLWQLPRGFVVHIPHPVSESSRHMNQADPVTGPLPKPPTEHSAYLKWFKGVPMHPHRIKSCPTISSNKTGG